MDDFGEIAGLLHIHKEAASLGGDLNNIAGAALNRLREINKDIRPTTFLKNQPDEKELVVPPTAPNHADASAAQVALATLPERQEAARKGAEEQATKGSEAVVPPTEPQPQVAPILPGEPVVPPAQVIQTETVHPQVGPEPVVEQPPTPPAEPAPVVERRDLGNVPTEEPAHVS